MSLALRHVLVFYQAQTLRGHYFGPEFSRLTRLSLRKTAAPYIHHYQIAAGLASLAGYIRDQNGSLLDTNYKS